MIWLCVALGMVGCSAPSAGQMTVEWWGSQQKCRHRTMTCDRKADGPSGLRYDLSQIDEGARVYHASLRMSTDKPKLPVHKRAYMVPGYYDPLRIYAEFCPRRPVRIYPLHRGEDGRPEPDEEPLELEPPRYRSFDVTDVVQEWVSGDRPNLGFLVEDFDIWVHWQSTLEVCYAGKPNAPLPPQPEDLRVVHRNGQTFITWTEIDKLIEEEQVRWEMFEETFLEAFPKMKHTWWKSKSVPRRAVWYRIYRHTEPITAANLAEAERVDEIYPLSGYDRRIHQHTCRGENWQGLDPDVIVPRYVISEPPDGDLEPTGQSAKGAPECRGEQLPLHTGLYVHQVGEPGKAYYAVTVLENGVENTVHFSKANSLPGPVDEAVGPGEPILYRALDQTRRRGRRVTPRESQFYVYWAAPPYHNLPRQPMHLMVSFPGPDPGKAVKLRSGIRDMYWSELVGGTHPHEWPKTGRLLTIIRDLPRKECGVNANCYTLRPPEPKNPQPYWDRLKKLLVPWAKTLQPRLIGR
ncbi:MAG: hypothetical protein R6V58_13710 [Planctomycetota bacterium]